MHDFERDRKRAGRRARPWGAWAVLALVLVLGSVGALVAGVFTPFGTQPPLVHPIEPPLLGGCDGCHGDPGGPPAHHFLPYDHWAGSMMANAARDPLFWAALDVANHDLPGIGDFCLRCHVPQGWYDGRSHPPGGTEDGCALAGTIDLPNLDNGRNDYEGVSCLMCHRMMVNPSPPAGEQDRYLENAQAWLDDGDCGGEGMPCRRGPYDYFPGDPTPPHVWAYSPYHLDHEICGNCHNVTSPLNDLKGTGVPPGIPYPIERTHREWEQSAYGPPPGGGAGAVPCQQCHMPNAPGNGPMYACVFDTMDRTGNLPQHEFVGGNTWVPRLLKGEYGGLGQLNREANFDDTIAWAQEQLHAAAQVALTAPGEVPAAQTSVDLSVRVTNLSGHKLPSGYAEGRRLWLQLRAVDGQGDLLWESGAYDPATGVLTEDPQLKLYRADQGTWNELTEQCEIVDGQERPKFHFVLNDCVRLDNRIPPLGFTGMDDYETRPVGYVYPETTPGSGVLVNYDDTDYQLALSPDAASPITIEARLLYQTASKEYVDFLRDQAVENGFPDDCTDRSDPLPAGTSRGEYLYSLWTQYDRSPPETVQLATRQLFRRLFRGDFETGNTSQWSLAVP